MDPAGQRAAEGVVVLGHPFGQPDHFLDSEDTLELGYHPVERPVGIPLPLDGLHREHHPAPVELPVAAFGDEVRSHRLRAEPGGHRAVYRFFQPRIRRIRRLVPPHVEAEVGHAHLAPVAAPEDGPQVPHPEVPVRHRLNRHLPVRRPFPAPALPDALPDAFPEGPGFRFVPGRQFDGDPAFGRPDDLDRQRSGGEATLVLIGRPRHPRRPVGFEFRGEGELLRPGRRAPAGGHLPGRAGTAAAGREDDRRRQRQPSGQPSGRENRRAPARSAPAPHRWDDTRRRFRFGNAGRAGSGALPPDSLPADFLPAGSPGRLP